MGSIHCIRGLKGQGCNLKEFPSQLKILKTEALNVKQMRAKANLVRQQEQGKASISII